MLGLGSAMAYQTLLAAISDVAHAIWRGSAGGTSSGLSRMQVTVRGPRERCRGFAALSSSHMSS